MITIAEDGMGRIIAGIRDMPFGCPLCGLQDHEPLFPV
jgi:hypothetical protein